MNRSIIGGIKRLGSGGGKIANLCVEAAIVYQVTQQSSRHLDRQIRALALHDRS